MASVSLPTGLFCAELSMRGRSRALCVGLFSLSSLCAQVGPPALVAHTRTLSFSPSLCVCRLHELVLLDLPPVLTWLVAGIKKLVHPDTRDKVRTAQRWAFCVALWLECSTRAFMYQ